MSQKLKPFARRTPEEWQQIIDQYKTSRLSQANFCKQNGISLATFCNWKRELAGNDQKATDDWVEPKFIS